MSVKKLIFSAASSILFLQFVVPLLGIGSIVSLGGTANIVVVAVFCVSTAGLIAEGCIALINASKKFSLHKPEIVSKNPASEQAPIVASAPSESVHIDAKSETRSPTPGLRSTVAPQAGGKRTKNHVDVLLGKEAVA